MNILYLCDEYPPCQHGGIGTVVQGLARSLVKQGHNVIVAGFYPWFRKAPDFEIDNGVKVYRFFYGNKLWLQLSKHKLTGKIFNIKPEFERYLNNINALVDKHEIDIIEMPDFSEAFYYGQFSDISFGALRKPYLIKLHGTYSYFSQTINGNIGNKRIFMLEKSLIKNASGIISISKTSEKINRELFAIETEVTHIPNGIQTGFCEPYLGKNSKKVVFAGTICEKKGAYSLAEAWRVVHTRFPEAELLMYGKGGETLKARFKDRIPTGIILKGAVSREELIEAYTRAACAVFPSFAESFSMAPIESMAVGCPTIFTKLSSGPELINNRIDGLLVDPGKPEEIAEAVIELLENRDFAVTLGENGKQKIDSFYDISLISHKHIDLYAKYVNDLFFKSGK